MNDKVVNVHIEGIRVRGAIDMLLRLRELRLLGDTLHKCDDLVYNRAEIDLALSSIDNCRRFLEGFTIHYKDHIRDKKGKLIKCTAYYGTSSSK